MSESDSETRGEKPQPAKKKTAKPGQVLESQPLPPGSAEAAAAKGGTVKPIDSSLLGDGTAQAPAASPRTATAGTSGAGAAATSSTPIEATSRTPSVTKPVEKPTEKATEKTAEKAAEKPAEKARETLADKPAEPVRRDIPDTRPAVATTPTPAPAPVTRVERTRFWPVALGGVVAAGLGAAATIWALPHLPESWRGTASAPVDVDALRAEAVAAAKAEVAAQGEAITAAAQDSATTAGAEAGRVSGSEAALAAIEERLAALTPAEPAAAPAPVSAEIAPPPLPADVLDGAADPRLAEMQAQIQAQARQIAELAARPALDPAVAEEFRALADRAAALQQQISGAAEAAQQSITAAQAEAQKLQEAAAESTRRAEAVAAVAALQTALDQGVSTEEAVDGLKAAGVQPPEAVNAGVPVLAELQETFDPAARAALQAALRADSPDEGPVGVIGNFLRAQTGARSVTPREGADPDAVLSRAGAAVEAGDIAAALSEIATLPEVARTAAPMAEWIAGAEAYAGARAALGELSGATN